MPKRTPRSTSPDDPFIRSLRMRWERVENRTRFPWSLPAFVGFDELPLNSHVTFFVGENGSGKSTLLEAIAFAAGMNLEGGGRNHNFKTTEQDCPIGRDLLLVRGARRPQNDFFLRAESFFNVSTYHEELWKVSPSPDPLKDLHYRSHGESFIHLLNERFGADGLYLLDEPEAALSPLSTLALMRRMHDLAARGTQFVVATHSPILMTYPGATTYGFGEDGIHPIDYRETTHYAITRRALEEPEMMLKELFEED